ncbi:thiol-disulfide oxidoreductase DCC family protein [Pseudomonas sp.]|uniref:thiol-disulfide oxidoreductase DCC family protein n=1 Tax=Pseudomonas sp. TaxID=306 RepID=UPI003A969C91
MHNLAWPLTLYYDGDCPLCAREIGMLRRHASPLRLLLVDIAAADFDPLPLGVSLSAMQDRLHARWADGEWVLGLDASLWSWEAAGLGSWVAPLRWRPLRPLLEWGYRLFCRLRPHLARLPHPDGAARCQEGKACSGRRPPSGRAG